jgi:ABC-type proline/glycine betaine transport system ATPase subunit
MKPSHPVTLMHMHQIMVLSGCGRSAKVRLHNAVRHLRASVICEGFVAGNG